MSQSDGCTTIQAHKVIHYTPNLVVPFSGILSVARLSRQITVIGELPSQIHKPHPPTFSKIKQEKHD